MLRPFVIVLQKSNKGSTDSRGKNSILLSCHGNSQVLEDSNSDIITGFDSVNEVEGVAKKENSPYTWALGWRGINDSNAHLPVGVEQRSVSRNLVVTLAESSDKHEGVHFSAEDEIIMDTRLMLLRAYGGGQIPFAKKITYRLQELRVSFHFLIQHALQQSMAREIGSLWLAWFVILCIEKFSPESDGHDDIFNTLFEVCSAYGNVGLSIGSQTKTNCSLSADFGIASQLVVVIIMFVGRLRGLPSNVDGCLELTSDIVIRESFTSMKENPCVHLGCSSPADNGGDDLRTKQSAAATIKVEPSAENVVALLKKSTDSTDEHC